jgi:hypothetical protein
MALTREQMRGAPPAPQAGTFEVNTAAAEAPAVAAEPEEAEPANEDPDAIPDGFVEQADGSWLYKLRFPLRPVPGADPDKDPTKVRLPAHVYVDDLMKAAAKNPTTAFEEIVYTLAAVTGVGDAIFRRLSEFDFRALSNAYQIRRRRAAAHPT